MTLTLKVLETLKMRNDNIRDLAEEMADMIQVLGDVPLIEKIKTLELTVTSMMTKIEECGNFIIGFIELGIFGMLLFASLSIP